MWTDVAFDFEDDGRSELEATLTIWWQQAFRVETIGLDQDFFALGGTSLIGAQIAAKVKKKYKVDLTFASLYDARTVARMADLILLKQNALETSAVVPIRTSGSMPPLFMIHGIGGNVLGFYQLAKRLLPDQPVYGIQAQALQPNGEALTRLEDMAAHYIRGIRMVSKHGPYCLLGFSFGGLVAYEIARQLKAQGEEVGLLGMLDTRRYDDVKPTMSLPRRLALRVYVAWMNLRRLSFRKKVAYVVRKTMLRLAHFYYRNKAVNGKASIPETMKSVQFIHQNAMASYKVLPYDGQVVLFRAEDDDAFQSPDLGWGNFASMGVEVHHLPGDHGQILAESNLGLLAEKLTMHLGQVSVRPLVQTY